MVHITLNGKPICEHDFIKCQYSTRREAFDAILRHKLIKAKIARGPCPNLNAKQED